MPRADRRPLTAAERLELARRDLAEMLRAHLADAIRADIGRQALALPPVAYECADIDWVPIFIGCMSPPPAPVAEAAWMHELPDGERTVCKHGAGDCDVCGTSDRRDARHSTVGGRGAVARLRGGR